MMKTLTGLCAVALLAAPALAEDPMAVMYENTAAVTYADGTVVGFHFNADGTFATDGDLAGAWRAEADQICITPAGADAEQCATVGAEARAVGDTYDITTADGSPASVTIVAGR